MIVFVLNLGKPYVRAGSRDDLPLPQFGFARHYTKPGGEKHSACPIQYRFCPTQFISYHIRYNMVMGNSDTIWYCVDPIHWPPAGALLSSLSRPSLHPLVGTWHPEGDTGSIVLASPTLVASWTNTAAHPGEPLQAGKSSDRLHSFLSFVAGSLAQISSDFGIWHHIYEVSSTSLT